MIVNIVIQVEFVDYGNQQFVTSEGLRSLKTQFVNLPAQAIMCTMADVVPAETAWTSRSKQQFEEIVYDQKFEAEVCYDFIIIDSKMFAMP